MILFDPATARDVLDGLRLLEGRVQGTSRSLSAGAQELRAVARRSAVVSSDHAMADLSSHADDARVPLLLTIDETALALHQSTSTVRRLVRTGDLPAVRIGAAVRVRPADLAAFIDSLPTTKATVS